jgi:hypothetical protein
MPPGAVLAPGGVSMALHVSLVLLRALSDDGLRRRPAARARRRGGGEELQRRHAAYLDVSAVAGHVHSDLEASSEPGGSARKVEIRARTSMGDIAIRRRG